MLAASCASWCRFGRSLASRLVHSRRTGDRYGDHADRGMPPSVLVGVLTLTAGACSCSDSSHRRRRRCVLRSRCGVLIATLVGLSGWLRARDAGDHWPARGPSLVWVSAARRSDRRAASCRGADRLGGVHHRLGRRVSTRRRRADDRSAVGDGRVRALRRVGASAAAQSKRSRRPRGAFDPGAGVEGRSRDSLPRASGTGRELPQPVQADEPDDRGA